jgi:hypothetical protein
MLNIGSTVIDLSSVASNLGSQIHHFYFFLLCAFYIKGPIFEDCADIFLDSFSLLDVEGSERDAFSMYESGKASSEGVETRAILVVCVFLKLEITA